jgi:hypothetical protein
MLVSKSNDEGKETVHGFEDGDEVLLHIWMNTLLVTQV